MYELSAVLIHRGISAYSGHYIAHVKDACTGDWYKFNDEEIEKMEGKKLQLGIEEDIGKLLTGRMVRHQLSTTNVDPWLIRVKPLISESSR